MQALVSRSNFGYPQRVATGFDARRMAILIAVLEKRSGLQLGAEDIFLNVAGGLRIDEPAVDLGVAMAMASSFRSRQMSRDTVVIGEVGLGGEVRAVGQIERRMAEACKLGFTRCVAAKTNLSGASDGVSLMVAFRDWRPRKMWVCHNSVNTEKITWHRALYIFKNCLSLMLRHTRDEFGLQ